MKQLTTLLFLAILATSCAQEATIGFYNVENLFDTEDTPDKDDAEFLPTGKNEWTPERYQEKIAHINQVYEYLGEPILFGMCEVETKQVVQDVVDFGKMKGTHKVVHHESTDQRGIDNALIYDMSVLNWLDDGIIRFEIPNSRPTRDILWAKFLLKSDTVLAMVNHWPSRSGGQVESEPKRMIAATAAKMFIDSVMNVSPTVKIVFMGDLNDYPTDRAPQMVSGVLNPQITPKSGEFGGTHNYRGEWGVLDHIMVSPNFTKGKGAKIVKKSGTINSPDFLLGEYKGQTVPARTYGGGKYLGGYSDHLPVSVRIKY